MTHCIDEALPSTIVSQLKKENTYNENNKHKHLKTCARISLLK